MMAIVLVFALFALLLVSAFFAYGMFTVQRPGFLLDGLPTLWKKFPKGLHEPLYACGVCTSSVWGGSSFVYQIVILVYVDNPVYLAIAYFPVVVIACAGIQAVLDRHVKACEKTYNYKPATKVDPAKKWDYLLPYEELRTMLVKNFFYDAISRRVTVVEVGGYHREWGKMNPANDRQVYWWFTESNQLKYHHQLPDPKDRPYDVIILGLAFDGDLRVLRQLIQNAQRCFIEYSDDGISRDQIEKITEGLNVKLVIPEYEIGDKDAPAACGSVSKRKIIMIQN